MTFQHCSPTKTSFVSVAPKFPAILVIFLLLSEYPAFAATTCMVPTDCADVGTTFCVDGFCCNTVCNGACDACSAETKGGGVDGECGLAAEGSTCKKPYCNGNTFAYVGPAKCTAAGACIEPAPVSCLEEKPCKLDLCSDVGCEHVPKLDGTECGNGMVCIMDECVMSASSSSSSSTTSSGSSGAGVGGAGGSGGSGGMGGTGGKGGSVNMGGMGGTDGSSSSGTTDPYPPSTGKGCTCSTTDSSSSSTGPTTVLFAAIAVALRRVRRATYRAP